MDLQVGDSTQQLREDIAALTKPIQGRNGGDEASVHQPMKQVCTNPFLIRWTLSQLPEYNKTDVSEPLQMLFVHCEDMLELLEAMEVIYVVKLMIVAMVLHYLKILELIFMYIETIAIVVQIAMKMMVWGSSSFLHPNLSVVLIPRNILLGN